MRLSVKGIALSFGILWGGMIFIVGLLNLGWNYADGFLMLISGIYPGYHYGGGFGSVIVATLYGLLDGAVGGAIFAWLYNCFAG
jgi:hypothetical protein